MCSPELRETNALAFTFLLTLMKTVQFFKEIKFCCYMEITLFWTDGSSPFVQIGLMIKVLSKSRVSAQLYFGPERSSSASKKYGIKTQIGCEILQVRNNLVKTGTFFLIVNLRGKKKKKKKK